MTDSLVVRNAPDCFIRLNAYFLSRASYQLKTDANTKILENVFFCSFSLTCLLSCEMKRRRLARARPCQCAKNQDMCPGHRRELRFHTKEQIHNLNRNKRVFFRINYSFWTIFLKLPGTVFFMCSNKSVVHMLN